MGGLLVVAAVAFFAKLALDKGWIGAVPPLVRAMLLAAVGIGLLIPADLLRRRLGNPAALGLAMAGIGTLYVNGWVMGPVLELLGPVGSLIAMAAAALVGLIVTIRFGSRLIGATSLVAAVVAPYLAGGEGNNVAAAIYFTSIFVVAFGLSAVRPRPFLGLRWISFCILVIGVLPWLASAIQSSAWDVVLITTTAWWFVIHVSSIHLGHRGFEWRNGASLMVASTALIAIPVPIAMRGLAVGSIEQWVPLGLGWLCVAFAFQSGVGLGAFNQVDSTSRRRDRCMHALASTAWLEGVTLAMVSLALLLPALGIPIAWAVTAVALGYHGRRFKSLPTTIFAGVLVLASQFAASIITMINWGGQDWFAGTPFKMEPVQEAITIPLAWAAAVVLAILWPDREDQEPGDDRNRTSVWVGLLLAIGILPTMIPALFIGDMGWWLLVCSAPFIASSLIARFRGEPTAADFPFVMGVICLLILVIGFMVGALVTIGEGSTNLAILLFAYGLLAMPLILLDVRRFGGDAGSNRLPLDIAGGIVMGLACSAASVTWLIGPVNTDLQYGEACVIASVGLVAGPLLLSLIRRKETRLIRPSVVVYLALIAVLCWIIGLLVMLDEHGSMAEMALADEQVAVAQPPVHFNVNVWSGLLLLGILCVQTVTSRTLPSTIRSMTPGLALFMGLATGSIFLYALLGPGTIGAQAGLSIWWAFYSIGLVVVGFMRGVPLVRHCGLGLLAITAIKFLVFDLSGAEPEYRVISALGIGLLMVGTSIVYARFGRRLDAELAEREDNVPPTG